VASPVALPAPLLVEVHLDRPACAVGGVLLAVSGSGRGLVLRHDGRLAWFVLGCLLVLDPVALTDRTGNPDPAREARAALALVGGR
jgi:hypothetical protein